MENEYLMRINVNGNRLEKILRGSTRNTNNLTRQREVMEMRKSFSCVMRLYALLLSLLQFLYDSFYFHFMPYFALAYVQMSV
mmetsp:Transcript_16249/g.27484  ORF Transcript_16249/g.27484 Transcript_16249/m.27484 type:complete len:82 (+) Transcript_16249:162-407(+)